MRQHWSKTSLRLLLCVWGLFALEGHTYVAKGSFATQAACDTAMRQLPAVHAVCIDWQDFIALYLNRNRNMPR